jgi:hypothetical protein
MVRVAAQLHVVLLQEAHQQVAGNSGMVGAAGQQLPDARGVSWVEGAAQGEKVTSAVR